MGVERHWAGAGIVAQENGNELLGGREGGRLDLPLASDGIRHREAAKARATWRRSEEERAKEKGGRGRGKEGDPPPVSECAFLSVRPRRQFVTDGAGLRKVGSFESPCENN